MKYINFFYYFLLFLAFSACKKEGTSVEPTELNYEKAKEVLPIYDNFIKYFKKKNYQFWSFHKYHLADKSNLPQKLIIIRHDVHHRDIKNAYYMYLIEKQIIGDNVASYYVMLNFPIEKTYTDYSQRKTDYLDLIQFLRTKQVDVQPHISIWDEYIEQYNPWWSNLSLRELKEIITNEYSYKREQNYYTIIYKTTRDSLGFKDVEYRIPELLKNYNEIWTSETGLEIESYAAHGSESPINHAFNNVILMNTEEARRSKNFKFETSSPEIFDTLQFLSDNNRPLWMENPDSIDDSRYEFLAHPDVWENPQAYRDKYWK